MVTIPLNALSITETKTPLRQEKERDWVWCHEITMTLTPIVTRLNQDSALFEVELSNQSTTIRSISLLFEDLYSPSLFRYHFSQKELVLASQERVKVYLKVFPKPELKPSLFGLEKWLMFKVSLSENQKIIKQLYGEVNLQPLSKSQLMGIILGEGVLLSLFPLLCLYFLIPAYSKPLISETSSVLPPTLENPLTPTTIPHPQILSFTVNNQPITDKIVLKKSKSLSVLQFSWITAGGKVKLLPYLGNVPPSASWNYTFNPNVDKEIITLEVENESGEKAIRSIHITTEN